MKKALFPAIFCLGAVLVAPSGFKANAGEGDIVAKTYLSKTKETTPIKYGVYVPLDKYNKGFSSFGSALEDISFQPKNKFLRLSNFSSAKGIKHSSVALHLDNMPVSSKVTVSFSYRFSEGQTPYKKDDTVFSFSLRNSVKSFTYEELEPQLFKDFSWKSASFDLDISDLSITSNQANLEYFFGNTSTATSLKNYFDIDNVQIAISDNNYFKNGSFDSFEVPEESSYLIQEVNLSKDERDPFINLKLDKEEIALFDQNTESTPLYFSGDDYFEHYSPMNGSALRYITSYPLYQVYSSKDENSFLRIQDFGDMPEINTFNNYFFNNETNEKENIKETRLFKFSFSYRLYMNEDIRNKYLSSGDHLLTLSTRECSKNGSGFINVDELSFNEKGDSTWHTYNGYLNTSSITLTSYFQFTYLNKSKPEDGTIVDIDNFYISSYDEDKNAFYGNGTFDFDLDSNYHPLTGDNAANVFAKDSYSRDSFGTGATEQNDSLYLGNGSSLS
ncbi:MAG: hypothetical protein MJ239_02745, partial [Bacilli bacterium]|nr:hypothetical protein [Bacilli bacterium]